MLDRTMFPFTDQRRTGQDNGKHGHVVDHLHHCTEPGLGQGLIETGTHSQRCRCCCLSPITPGKFRYFTVDDCLNMVVASKGLGHASGIDIELNSGRTSS